MDISVPSSRVPSHAPALAVRPPSGVVRLQQLMRVLRRHMLLIGACAVVAGTGAYAAGRTAPKVYTAASTITVEGDKFAIPELQGALRSESAPDPMPWVRTEVQALSSRALLSQVVADLKLDTLPEFNPALRAPTLLQRLRERVSAAVMPMLPAGPDDAPAPGPDEAVISAVGKALSVFQDNRSLVIALSFTSEDPRLASSVLNTLVADYVKTQSSRRNSANESASSNIAQRIEQVRGELSGIDDRMRALRSQGELVGVRAGSVGQQQAEELATAAARAMLERSQLETNYERAVAAAKSGSSDTLAAVLNSPTISRFRDQEGTASNRLAELSSRYGSNYPGLRSAAAEVSSARSQLAQEASRIVASLGAQLRVAREQEASVQRQLDIARKSGVQAENARAELDQLQQEATGRRALYQTLLERAQQTTAPQTSSDRLDVRIISAAVPPGQPSGPNVKLTALMGGAGGALLGCCLALLRIRSTEGFETAAEVTDATGLPVVASFPRGLLRPGRGLLGAGPAAGRTGPVPELEPMRQLRERLRHSGRTGSPRSAMIVPVQEGPLAARTAAALARAAAASGERVLLVEGDLQRPSLARLLGSTQGALPRVLAGEDWQEAVTEQDGVGLLLAPPDAGPGRTGAFGGMALHNLLVEASGDYDLVVLTAPPAGSADAAALVQWAEVVVLLIEERTGYAALQQAVSQLGAAYRTSMVAALVTRA